MTKKPKQIAWIVLMAVAVAAGFIGIRSFQQFSRMEDDALEACQAYLHEQTGENIAIADLQTTAIEIVFPRPLDKRFRTNRTYNDVTVKLGSKPFKPWTVISATGLE